MFHPVDRPMERGWVGRVDGDRVIHLAAQTLQSFFTGGGSAREHDVYPLSEVRLLAPVLHPPSVRVFDEQGGCAFANPAAIVGPGATIAGDLLTVFPRMAGIVGAEDALAAFTILADWRDPARQPPKDRDFALGFGPVAVTTDAFDPSRAAVAVRVGGEERASAAYDGFDWDAAVSLAAEGTKLYPGDVIAGPTVAAVQNIEAEGAVEVEVRGLGVLAQARQPSERYSS